MMRILYIVVNLLFVLKYSLRISSLFALVATVCYLIFAVGLLFGLKRIPEMKGRMMIIIIFFFILLAVIGQAIFDPEKLQVDRWSAIDHFIGYLLAGQYPYAATTHLGGYGSPFPVWQVFHIPFYLLGNVALSFVPVTALLVWSIYRLFGGGNALRFFLLLICSPAFCYEVLVRSDLMTNFMLVLAIINMFLLYHIRLKEHPWTVAVIAGLMMSTRLSAVIPFAVFFMTEYLYDCDWKKKAAIPLLSLAVFAVTFLPFLLWDSDMLLFFQYNPFILQSRQGNITDFLIFVPALIGLSLTWKKFNTCLLHMAYMLLLLVIVTFVHNMWMYDNWDALFSPFYDITYLNMSLPFLILSVCTDGNPLLWSAEGISSFSPVRSAE